MYLFHISILYIPIYETRPLFRQKAGTATKYFPLAVPRSRLTASHNQPMRANVHKRILTDVLRVLIALNTESLGGNLLSQTFSMQTLTVF